MTVYTPKQYAERLATAGLRLKPGLTATLNRGAFNIRDDWRDRAAAKNPVHAPRYASTIIRRKLLIGPGGTASITVEPMKRHQGNLGKILEYGTARSRAQMSHIEALDAELPNLIEWMARLVVKPIK